MRTRSSFALACTLGALLSACGGSGGHGPLPNNPAPTPSTPSSSPTPSTQANVEFVVQIPPAPVSAASIASSRAHRQDFSASTQSVTIAIGTQVLKTASVSATSSFCAPASGGGRTCTIGVTAPSGNDLFTITAYDQANGTGNAIAQGTMQQSITAQPATVKVVVDGTIAKLALALSNPYPPSGTSTKVNVVVTGLDVDGNVVMGAYPSPVSLQDSDTSGTTSLSTTTVANSSTKITLNYTGAPFVSTTVTASLSNIGSASASFAPTPAFLNNYVVPQVPFGPFGTAAVGVWNITKGPDGNMWVVSTGISEVIKVASNGAMTVYPMSNPADQLQGIVAGADGNLWFAEFGNNAIGKITTSGVITEYPVPLSPAPTPQPGYPTPPPGVPTPPPSAAVVTVGLGPDGNVWFFDQNSHKAGNITPGGTITEYPLSSSSEVVSIITGPDKNLWMGDVGDNAVLKVSTSGQILATYPLPTQNAYPTGLSPGPDGNVWFVEENTGKIGRITTSGSLAEFAVPSGVNSAPLAIKAGPDGRMWFAEQGPPNGPGKIGYITIDGKQSRDFFNQGAHVRDLAFDANGTLWSLQLSSYSPFGANWVTTVAY